MRESDGTSSVGVGFINGEIVPISEAGISVVGLGFPHSDAIFDVVRVCDCRFFRLDDHLRRFMNVIAKRHMAIDFDHGQIRRIPHDCVRASGPEDAHVEMVYTRCETESNSRDPLLCKSAFYALVTPFFWIATLDEQGSGLNLHVGSACRIALPRPANYCWPTRCSSRARRAALCPSSL